MDAEYLVAREGGDAVGCGMSAVFPGMGDEPILWSDASVLPDRRSNGIGEQLLCRISERGRELGKQELLLEVREDDEHRSDSSRGAASGRWSASTRSSST